MTDIDPNVLSTIRRLAHGAMREYRDQSVLEPDDVAQEMIVHWLAHERVQTMGPGTGIFRREMSTFAAQYVREQMEASGASAGTVKREYINPRYRYEAKLVRRVLDFMYQYDPAEWPVLLCSDSKPAALTLEAWGLAVQVMVSVDSLREEDRSAIERHYAEGDAVRSEALAWQRAATQLTEIVNAAAWQKACGDGPGSKKVMTNAKARSAVGKGWSS